MKKNNMNQMKECGRKLFKIWQRIAKSFISKTSLQL